MATIHKLLTRDEMRNDPRAIKATQDEGKGVREKNVWSDISVMEKSERITLAKQEGKTIHLAEVMPLASIKHWESPERRKYKGRLVSRGGQVRDTWGGAAQFGEMYLTPTNIQAINLAIYYGIIGSQDHHCRLHTCLSASTFDNGRRNVRPFATGTLARILVWEVSSAHGSTSEGIVWPSVGQCLLGQAPPQCLGQQAWLSQRRRSPFSLQMSPDWFASCCLRR
jgi:hypothetical protein